MATGKPLVLLVDEDLYDLKEMNDLVEQGHTIKKLMHAGFDLILGRKASNLTPEDVKSSPKLLEIAILKGKEMKYPTAVKQVKSKSEKKRLDIQQPEVQHVVEDTKTPTREAAQALPVQAAPVKRRTRRTKQQIADDNRRDKRLAGINNTPDSPTDLGGE